MSTPNDNEALSPDDSQDEELILPFLQECWLAQERGESLSTILARAPATIAAKLREILALGAVLEHTTDQLRPVLSSRYIPLAAEPIGSGGMGVVWKVWDQQVSRIVAMKVLDRRFATNELLKARFRTETKAMASLINPGIVTVFDSGIDAGYPYLTMEYVNGPNLHLQINRKPQPQRTAALLLHELALTTQSIHRHGLIHRDLKPSNILLAPQTDAIFGREPIFLGRNQYYPKISDFGLAKILDAGTNMHLTRPGEETADQTVLGTPSYMPPEQARGIATELDARADVYALGAILYELLVGHPPFETASPNETLDQVRNANRMPPVRPGRHNPAIHPELEAICLKCLEYSPADRYGSAQALADDLGNWLSHRPTLARPLNRLQRTMRLVRRHPSIAMLSFMLCAFVVVAFAVVTWLWRDASYAWKQAALHEDEALSAKSLADQKAVEAEALAEQRRQAQVKAETDRDHSHSVQHRQALEAFQREFAAGQFLKALSRLYDVPELRRDWDDYRRVFECENQPRPTQVLTVHDSRVFALLIDPNGKTVISSGADGRMLISTVTDSADPIPVRELKKGIWYEQERYWAPVLVHRARELALVTRALCPDPFGNALHLLPWSHPVEMGRHDAYQALAWLEPGKTFAAASLFGHGTLWSVKDGLLKEMVSSSDGCPMNVVATDSNGKCLFGDESGVLYLCQPDAPGHSRLKLGQSPIQSLVHLRSEMWAVGQLDGSLSLVDARVSKVLAHFQEPGPIWGLDETVDGGWLAAAGNRVVLFQLDPTRAALVVQEVFDSPDEAALARPVVFHNVCFSPDGQQVFASDDKGRVASWTRPRHVPRFVQKDQIINRANPSPGLPSAFRRSIGALLLSPDGLSLFTAGSDTAVKRWHLRERDGVTRFATGQSPRVLFDPLDPGLIWVGDARGELTLWDSHEGQKVNTAFAHARAIIGMDACVSRPIVATLGADEGIRFWMRHGRSIQPAEGFASSCQRLANPRSISLAPDGRYVAAYDHEDKVMLWDAHSGELLDEFGTRPPGQIGSNGGLVAFSQDGRHLAATGPGQLFWLFDIANGKLSNPHTSLGVAGAGCTALARFTAAEPGFAAGDTVGRVTFHPPVPGRSFRAVLGAPISVSAMAFTPACQRLGVVAQDGRIMVFGQHELGLVYETTTNIPNPTGIAFDPTGTRLCIWHQDGRVHILETERKAPEYSARIDSPWQDQLALSGPEARSLTLSHRGTVIDSSGRITLLLSRLSSEVSSGHTVDTRILQAVKFNGSAKRELVIPECKFAGVESAPMLRSVALRKIGDTLFGAYRRPRPDIQGYSSELVLFRLSPSLEFLGGRAITPVANLAADTHLFASPRHEPIATHFAAGGYYLILTKMVDGEWESFDIGREGDGLFHQAVQGADGRIHCVFYPHRLADDLGPLTYLSVVPNEPEKTVRDELDATQLDAGHHRGHMIGIALSPRGDPIVAYARPRRSGYDTIIAQHTSSGWSRSVALPWLPPSPSNLVCDKAGRGCFAFLDAPRRRIYVASSTPSLGAWQTQLVWTDTGKDDPLLPDDWDVNLVMALDENAAPLLIAYRCSEKNGWLRFLRPGQANAPAF